MIVMRVFLAVGFLAAVAAVGVFLRVERPWESPSEHSVTIQAVASPTSQPAAATPRRRRARTGAPTPAATSAYATAGCGNAAAAGGLIDEMSTPEGIRSYRLHIPANYHNRTATPLVVNFHGYGRTALEQETYSQFVPVSERNGFILVTPEGSGSPQGWDIPGVYAENGYDDVGFVAQLVAELGGKFCLDTRRMYATGLSNGAEMASLVGCRLPYLFAAVAPVAGVIYDGCDGGPMPVIAFHGTEDYNVPFEIAPPAMADWAGHNGCTGELESTPIGEHVREQRYSGCEGEDVILYVIEGGGHTWPGAEDDAGGVGPTTHEINASELIWLFFASHPKPGS
jgi:polyhydroxybutyrate depolymerase